MIKISIADKIGYKINWDNERNCIPMEYEIMSTKEAAHKLNVSQQYICSLIKKGALSAVSLGKQWVINENDLLEFIKNNDVEPYDHKCTLETIPPIVALSFFSGAMGLDIGMERAGIKSILACEIDKSCRKTIYKNTPKTALIGDIRKYSGNDILKMAGLPIGRKIDVMFGGPPCQAFSTAGNRKGLDDERGNVFLKYIDLIEELKPQYIVIENVRGLLSATYPYNNIIDNLPVDDKINADIKGGVLLHILRRLRKIGYTVSFNLYNSANFNAPQIRERVVIIGYLGESKVPYLIPTNSESGEFNLPKWNTLEYAFSSRNIMENHYINFPEERLKYYRQLKEGQNWKNLTDDLQREALGKSYFLGGGKTGFLRRLSFEKPSPTLVTHPAMPATDLAHPIEDRPLSVEEYSAIQGFPETWKICGSLLEQYKQIGNAVPISLGESIGILIQKHMRNENIPIYENFKYSRYRNTDDINWEKEVLKQIKKVNCQANQLSIQ